MNQSTFVIYLLRLLDGEYHIDFAADFMLSPRFYYATRSIFYEDMRNSCNSLLRLTENILLVIYLLRLLDGRYPIDFAADFVLSPESYYATQSITFHENMRNSRNIYSRVSGRN